MNKEFKKVSTTNPVYKGKIISQEQYEQIFKKYKIELDEEYNKIINTIVNSIPNNISKTNKLRAVFDYLVQNCNIEENYISGISPLGNTANSIFYKYKDYDIKYAASSNKYGPIIFKKGVCLGFAEAFKDICEKLGIKCEILTGITTIGHAWNVVSINDEIMHVDIYYGIAEKNSGKVPIKYFLVDTNKLISYSNHKDFIRNLEQIKPLIQKNINESDTTNGFRVVSKEIIPGFKIKR